jgi:hypothetical protein
MHTHINVWNSSTMHHPHKIQKKNYVNSFAYVGLVLVSFPKASQCTMRFLLLMFCLTLFFHRRAVLDPLLHNIMRNFIKVALWRKI